MNGTSIVNNQLAAGVPLPTLAVNDNTAGVGDQPFLALTEPSQIFQRTYPLSAQAPEGSPESPPLVSWNKQGKLDEIMNWFSVQSCYTRDDLLQRLTENGLEISGDYLYVLLEDLIGEGQLVKQQRAIGSGKSINIYVLPDVDIDVVVNAHYPSTKQTDQTKLEAIMHCFSEKPCYSREDLFLYLKKNKSDICLNYLYNLLNVLVSEEKLVMEKRKINPGRRSVNIYALPGTNIDAGLKADPPSTELSALGSCGKVPGPNRRTTQQRQETRDATINCFSVQPCRYTREQLVNALKLKGITIKKTTMRNLINQLIKEGELIALDWVSSNRGGRELVYGPPHSSITEQNSTPSQPNALHKRPPEALLSKTPKRARREETPQDICASAILSFIDDAALTALQISNKIGRSLEETQQCLEMLRQQGKVLPYGVEQWVTVELHTFLRQLSEEGAPETLCTAQAVASRQTNGAISLVDAVASNTSGFPHIFLT